MKSIVAYKGLIPRIHSSVYLADVARVIGDVTIDEESSVWFNAVIRGDVNYIRIGKKTNVQDNSVLHVTTSTAPLTISDEATIGHSAVLHGFYIENCCLIGIGAIVLDNTHIHRNSIIAAGSMVLGGFDVSEGVLVAGMPAKIKRSLNIEEIQMLHQSADNYSRYAYTYRS
jgi:carbonic anhydrase/acetyltransferase-like protein (isoleucine patch superfamily)